MSDDKEKDEEKPVVAKTAVDLQRLKLTKLMKNIVSTISSSLYITFDSFPFLITSKRFVNNTCFNCIG